LNAEHYNYFRDYDPSIGRYTESDPIGISGYIAASTLKRLADSVLGPGVFEAAPLLELNLFGYVAANPLRWIDPSGTSTLSFDRGSGQLCAIDKAGATAFCCNAANNTTKNSNGPWPNGNYPFSWHNPHPKGGPQSFGSHGIFIFDVPGRSGMGVHSGRSGPSSPTEGCIRTDDPCVKQIKTLHSSDPLTDITVK
jgi:hypothetical protein